MYCTQKVRHKKSNFWGVFLMKLTYEDKIQIYQLWKQDENLKNLSKNYILTVRNLHYLVKFIDRYGIESVKKEKNRTILQN